MWKIRRDTAKRGYTVEQVLEALRKREQDSIQFIHPQRKYADIVVRFYPPPEIPPERANGNLNVRLILRPTIPHPDMTELLEYAGGPKQPPIRLILGRDSARPVDILEIDGGVSHAQAEELENLIWQHMPPNISMHPERLGIYLNGTHEEKSDPLALVQLLLAYHMFVARDMPHIVR